MSQPTSVPVRQAPAERKSLPFDKAPAAGCERGKWYASGATINDIATRARETWVRFWDSDAPLILGSMRRLIEVAERTGAGVAYGRALPYGPNPLAAGAKLGLPDFNTKLEQIAKFYEHDLQPLLERHTRTF